MKHLYLDINGIRDGAAVAAVAGMLPQLESLSINVNQLRDDGFKAFVDALFALKALPQLTRFVVGSNALTDASLPLLTELVERIPTITVLQLGSYKSTRFFQQQANLFSSYEGMLKLAKAL